MSSVAGFSAIAFTFFQSSSLRPRLEKSSFKVSNSLI
nr:MAG TPA: hypothetical protein [Caudoviricetes sp.]